ncbi:hemerythrin domain-containing protein [Terrabacter aeriphilus]
MAEHVEIINASGDLRRACERRDDAAVERAAHRLGHLLDPHTSAEESGIFAVLSEDPEFTDHVATLCAEHDDLGRQLVAIRRGEHRRFPVFERALRDHIDREENGLFPAAAIAFAGPEWDRVESLTPAAHGHPHEHPHAV